MTSIKVIEAFETSDGRIFKDRELAFMVQREINVDAALKSFFEEVVDHHSLTDEDIAIIRKNSNRLLHIMAIDQCPEK